MMKTIPKLSQTSYSNDTVLLRTGAGQRSFLFTFMVVHGYSFMRNQQTTYCRKYVRGGNEQAKIQIQKNGFWSKNP